MNDSAVPPRREHNYTPPAVVDGETVDGLITAATVPLRYAPVVWVPMPEPVQDPNCRCGNVTERGHNGYSCDEVLAIRARVEYGQLSRARRLFVQTPAGWSA